MNHQQGVAFNPGPEEEPLSDSSAPLPCIWFDIINQFSKQFLNMRAAAEKGKRCVHLICIWIKIQCQPLKSFILSKPVTIGKWV